MCDNVGMCRTSQKNKGHYRKYKATGMAEVAFCRVCHCNMLDKRQIYFLFVAGHVLVAFHVLSNMSHYLCRKDSENSQSQLRTPQLLSPTRLLQ